MRFATLIWTTFFLTLSVALPVSAQGTSRLSNQQLSPPSPISAANRPRISPIDSITDENNFRPRSLKHSATTLVADGYCLVSLRDKQTWIQGDPKIQIVFDGKLYLFAGIRERDIFAAAPEAYLPVLDGDSIVAFAESGQRVAGELQFGLTYRDRLYFFQNAKEQAEFNANPNRYLNTDLVDQGYCPVSKVDEKKLVPGLPETVITIGGMRYYFASARYRKLFIATPERYVESRDKAKSDLQLRGGSVSGFAQTQDHPKDSQPGNYPTPDEIDSKAINQESEPEVSETEFYARPAISGYCPVSIQKQGVWVRGKSKYKATFDGKIYHMAGADELALFRENPRDFVPVLGGDSIVAFVDQSKRIAGTAYQPLIAGGRLFLFADANEKKSFKDNLSLYENADLVLQGNCLVSLIDDQRETPGLPAYETLFQGLRYRFASQAHMKKFLSEPELYFEQFAAAQSQDAQ